MLGTHEQEDSGKEHCKVYLNEEAYKHDTSKVEKRAARWVSDARWDDTNG